MKLLGLYENILKYFGLEADKTGFIYYSIDDKRDPVLVDEKQLVLPLPEHLRNFDPKQKVIFHPFAENVMRGESAVIKKLRSCINIKLNYTIGIIVKSLLNIVASPALHSKLNVEQMKLLTSVKDADEKSVINFISVMNNGIKNKADRLFANVYMMRGGTFNGKRFSKVGIVSFPYYEELVKNEKVDKLRVKDREAYLAIFKFIFPNIDDIEYYNYGSNERAPFFDALLRSSCNLAERLNTMLMMFEDYIDDADSFIFESQWLDHIENLHNFENEIRRIPVQDGNEGSIFNDVEIPEIQENVTQQRAVATNTQVGYNQNQGNWNQQIANQKPEIVKTNRGIDFKSLANSNPAIAFTPNALPPNVLMQQMMRNGQMPMNYSNNMVPMQNPVPTWAQPNMNMNMNMMNQMPFNGNMGNMIQTPNGPIPVSMMQTPNGPMPVAMTPNGPMQIVMQPNGVPAFYPLQVQQGFNNI